MYVEDSDVSLKVVLDYISEVKHDLMYELRLQFQDPESDDALCSSVNIEDLPSNSRCGRSVLHEQQDAVLLSDNTDPAQRLRRWPEVSYEAEEYSLSEGGSVSETDGAQSLSSYITDQQRFSQEHLRKNKKKDGLCFKTETTGPNFTGVVSCAPATDELSDRHSAVKPLRKKLTTLKNHLKS